MKEKKVIDYTRTYRRIEADKKKCILYIVILILLGFLLMWTQIDDLTRMICKICAGVLKKYEPHMYVGIRSETYPLFGKISYLSAGTVYPGIKISLINTGISLGMIILLAGLPWKGRPLAIYLILCSAIHLINSLWFVFGEKYFPYTLTVYSKLYMLQEIGIWVMFFVMTVMVTGIIGDRGVIYKLLTLLAIMLYSIVFGTVRSYYERLYYFCYYSDASVHSQTSGRSACVGKTSTGHAGYNRTSGRSGSRNLKACRHEDG